MPSPPISQSFGQMLKTARKRQKLTQEDLAAAVVRLGAKVSQGYISLIERNAGTPGEPVVGRDLVEVFAAILFLNRDEALRAAGHNPDPPIHRSVISPTDQVAARIMIEFEVVGRDGKRRPLRPEEVTPGMRKQLADLLLETDPQNAGE